MFFLTKHLPEGALIPVRDIHCHILPGVDDGFRKTEDSIEALNILQDYGVHDIVLTPHMNPDVYPGVTEIDIKRKFEQFKQTVPENLNVKISLASEYMVVNGFEDRDPSSLLVYDDNSVLIEMSYYFRSRNMEDAIFNLTMAGLRPIIAHPERYGYMTEEMMTFRRWREMGCRFQMNCLSATGIYGSSSIDIMKYLLERNWYDFIATDLHSLHQLKTITEGQPVSKLRRALEKNGLI